MCDAKCMVHCFLVKLKFQNMAAEKQMKGLVERMQLQNVCVQVYLSKMVHQLQANLQYM